MLTLALAGGLALAAPGVSPFTVLKYEAGHGLVGVVGAGFDVTPGPGMPTNVGFYNRLGVANTRGAGTSPLDPLTWIETTTNHNAYDSYFTLDGSGPSFMNEADSTGETLSPQIAAFYGINLLTAPTHWASSSGSYYPDSFIGMSGDLDGQLPFNGSMSNPANTPLVQPRRAGVGLTLAATAGPSPIGDGVFVAQLTINRGSTLSGGIVVTIDDGTPPGISDTLTLDGPARYIGTHELSLRAYKVATHDNLSHSRSGGNVGTQSGSVQRFGAADVYHLWIETVPTPGGAGLLAAGALASIRRRRAV